LSVDIHGIFQLAELKSVFDRFAVDSLMTAPETCQALTEAGLIVPRRFASGFNRIMPNVYVRIFDLTGR
jgi:hypothetical protein